MIYLSWTQCEEWAKSRRLPPPKSEACPPFWTEFVFRLPAESLRQAALAEAMIAALGPLKEALFVTWDVPLIRPLQQRILEDLRHASGESAPFLDRPGLHVGQDEEVRLAEHLYVHFSMLADCSLLAGDVFIRASNDEGVFVWSRTPAELSGVQAALTPFALEVWKA